MTQQLHHQSIKTSSQHLHNNRSLSTTSLTLHTHSHTPRSVSSPSLPRRRYDNSPDLVQSHQNNLITFTSPTPSHLHIVIIIITTAPSSSRSEWVVSALCSVAFAAAKNLTHATHSVQDEASTLATLSTPATDRQQDSVPAKISISRIAARPNSKAKLQGHRTRRSDKTERPWDTPPLPPDHRRHQHSQPSRRQPSFTLDKSSVSPLVSPARLPVASSPLTTMRRGTTDAEQAGPGPTTQRQTPWILRWPRPSMCVVVSCQLACRCLRDNTTPGKSFSHLTSPPPSSNTVVSFLPASPRLAVLPLGRDLLSRLRDVDKVVVRTTSL